MIITELTSKECGDALKSASLGRLGCAKDNQPYVVPIFFVTDDDSICAFATPGQKIDWMRDNPLVCLQLDGQSGADWTSVIVFGRFTEVVDADERRRVHTLLQARPMWWEPGGLSPVGKNDPDGYAPIFYRISKTSMTGLRYSSLASTTSSVRESDDAEVATQR